MFLCVCFSLCASAGPTWRRLRGGVCSCCEWGSRPLPVTICPLPRRTAPQADFDRLGWPRLEQLGFPREGLRHSVLFVSAPGSWTPAGMVWGRSRSPVACSRCVARCGCRRDLLPCRMCASSSRANLVQNGVHGAHVFLCTVAHGCRVSSANRKGLGGENKVQTGCPSEPRLAARTIRVPKRGSSLSAS